MRAECLGDALAQILEVVLLGGKAGRVDHAQVERRVTLDQPRGQRLANAAAEGHAGRVHAGSDPDTGHARRRAEQEVRIGCERLGTIDEALEANLFEDRQAMPALRERRLEVLPVVLEQRER